MDWDKLRIFYATAGAGSFTRAAQALQMSQPAVSRQIAALERSLGAPLFHRHARGLRLTEQGEVLLTVAREISGKLAMAEARIAESRDKPAGELIITTTVAFGSLWLLPRIKGFFTRYPEIAPVLRLTDDKLDLSMREADVAIRMLRPREPDLVQRRLAVLHVHLYASQEYIGRRAPVRGPADLATGQVIIYGEGPPAPFSNLNWALAVAGGAESGVRVLRINSLYGMVRAAALGLGVAALPDYTASAEPALVPVLPEHDGPSFEAYFVYPQALRHSPRVAAFRGFLLQAVGETRF